MIEHVHGGLVDGAAPGCDVLVGFPLSSQPFGRGEPRLVGGGGHVAADRDRPIVVHGEFHLIALADVEGAADLLREGELPLEPTFTRTLKRGSASILASGTSITCSKESNFLLSCGISASMPSNAPAGSDTQGLKVAGTQP
jgi:hypothetical protein